MTKELIERLLEQSPEGMLAGHVYDLPALREAAAEIERLRTAIREGAIANVETQDQMMAEIERLRRELDWYAKERDRLLSCEAEIERRRADYSILKGDYDALREELADVRADAALLRGDIKTLQSELRHERTARRALEPKP